ncbi:hypothetical protein PUN28_002026 [Cardiocondyla obscurior]|uniref:Transmembrane protein n=1 Tax=Cardiocondyla obscurior TaxID=286306 RepID=A0AAW2GSD8_9HYME
MIGPSLRRKGPHCPSKLVSMQMRYVRTRGPTYGRTESLFPFALTPSSLSSRYSFLFPFSLLPGLRVFLFFFFFFFPQSLIRASPSLYPPIVSASLRFLLFLLR